MIVLVMSSWETFREEMPVTKDYCYFNHAAVGPLPKTTSNILKKIAEEQLAGDVLVDIEEILAGFPDTRKEIANLINANSEEIALTMATAHGIGLILTSLDWNKRRNSGIIINDMEYNSNSFPYQMVCRRNPAVWLHVLKSRSSNGARFLDFADFEEIFETQRISLVAVSHVQFTNGFRIDLRKLAKMAHNHGALLLVDGIQSVGAINLDVKETDIDFLSAGGVKWMLGPEASGFLYVRSNLLEELNPVLVGSLSDENPLDFQHHEFHPRKNALKLQGCFLPQNRALGASIAFLNRYGIRNIENQIKKLTDYLIDQISQKVPAARVESLRGQAASGIVRITFPDGVNTKGVVKSLREKYRIITAYRSGGLRASPHCYNIIEEIDAFIDGMKKQLETSTDVQK